MRHPALKEIVLYITHRLQSEFGFAGVAMDEKSAVINSSLPNGQTVLVKIEIKNDATKPTPSAWTCQCNQLNTGWATRCGRCERER